MQQSETTKIVASHNVPWEHDYGYYQAVRVGNSIIVSGQLSHDDEGNMIAPAEINSAGKPLNFSAMQRQMEVAYANAKKILSQFGASLDNVVEETLYVLDVDAAFAVAKAVRSKAYGIDRPRCASNLIGVGRLAFPTQLIEIVFRAELDAV
jgi:enamine deaminase RidA (YjgF/YER057c/UK114 family)